MGRLSAATAHAGTPRCRPGGGENIVYPQTPTSSGNNSLASKLIAIVDAYLGLPTGTNPFGYAAAPPAPSGGSDTGAIVGGASS